MDLISVHVQIVLDRNELKCIRNYFALISVDYELKHLFSSFALIRLQKQLKIGRAPPALIQAVKTT
jgi:hypothetical protein